MAEKRACHSFVLTNGRTHIEEMFFTDNIKECRGCLEKCWHNIEILIRIQEEVKRGSIIELEELEEIEE